MTRPLGYNRFRKPKFTGAQTNPNSLQGGARWTRSERGRSIDQLKRLYAVVMGFALTAGMARAASREIEIVSFEGLAILLNIFTIISISILVFLSAERHLENKYVLCEIYDPPLRTLSFDLLAMFVVSTSLAICGILSSEEIDTDRFHKSFIISVMIFHIIDFVILVLGLIMNTQFSTRGEDEVDHIISVLNLVGLSLVAAFASFLVLKPDLFHSWFYINSAVPAFLLFLVHFVKFTIDLKANRPLYFLFQKEVRPIDLFRVRAQVERWVNRC